MPSVMTLEGAHASAMPRLWTPSERAPGLAGDNAVVTWMKAQPVPVAIAASIGLSLGVGFLVSAAFIKLIGKGGSSKAVAGARGRRERIPGGKAAGRSPREFDQRELAKGIKVEMEHTRSKQTAREIAMDHLAEEPRYYTKLARTGLRGTKTDPALAALLKGQRDGMAGRDYLPPATHVEKYRQGYAIGQANRKAKGLAGATSQHGFKKLKVDRGWPETWEKKVGHRYWVVEKTKAGDWRYGDHGGNPDHVSFTRCAPGCTKEQAISRAYRDAKSRR